MIRGRDCPRCYGSMVYDMGPAMDPTLDGNVELEAVYRCTSCGREEAVHRAMWSDMEIQRAVAAVRSLHGTPDLDERAKVLADHGYQQGKRWWPRVEA